MYAGRLGESMPDVTLVHMPFGPRRLPSLGLSLLKPALDAAGISCCIRYFSADYSRAIGDDLYDLVGDQENTGSMLGEWLFSSATDEASNAGRRNAAMPHGDPDANDYVDRVLRRKSPDHFHDRPIEPADLERVLAARAGVPAFVEACADELAAIGSPIVGFTSTFQQHCASIAAAWSLKVLHPSCVVLFGGANCEGDMGAALLDNWNCIDAVVSGEGEEVAPPLIRALLDGQEAPALPGVITRRPRSLLSVGVVPDPGRATVDDLDALPLPDFDDFASDPSTPTISEVPFETSRGCWWGERRHCTFCGLNGSSMAYRSKSAARAVAEVEELARRHPGAALIAVDNILDRDYLDTVIEVLGQRRAPLDLFYETKADLGPIELDALARAGVRSFQPGIESLSSDALRRMRKGATAASNIALLRQSEERGLAPQWNFLWGFPGEHEGTYEDLATSLGALTHLPPPGGYGQIGLHRFSPLHDAPEESGLVDVRPLETYDHIYRMLPPAERARLAYYFAFAYQDGRDPATYTSALVTALRSWKDSFDTAALFTASASDKETVRVVDLRPGTRPLVSDLPASGAAVLDVLDGVRTRTSVIDVVGPDAGDTLDHLERVGLVFRDGPRVVRLTIPLDRYAIEGADPLATEVRRLKMRMAHKALAATRRPHASGHRA